MTAWVARGAAIFRQALEFALSHAGWRNAAAPQANPTRAPQDASAPDTPRKAAANEVFTPTRPRAGRRTLVGRHVELTQALQALTGESAHVVLYSERGRGKTSLANLVVDRLRRGGVIVGRHACDASANFDQIMHGLMADLPASLLPVGDGGTGFQNTQGCDGILPRTPLLPADVAAIPARLACPSLVFVVDEFDRVQDQATRTRLADTIKLLSDRGAKLLFMIVGVSTTLEEIIGQHPSIERNISALHLPLLDDGDIADMLIRGGQAAGVEFTPFSCGKVALVARGMPYMAQLMGLRMTQSCLMRGGEQISGADVAGAVERLIADSSADVAGRYAALTAAGRNADMVARLYRIATAPQDKWGRVTLPDAGDAATESPGHLALPDIVQPAHGVPGLYQFSDRRLMYYVLLLAARDGAPATQEAAQPAQGGPLPALRNVAAASIL